ARKYRERGKPCPIAVVNGPDPALFVAGFEYLPEGVCEYDFAGAIKGRPIEVVPGPHTGLPLPARAESVLEGTLLPITQTSRPAPGDHRAQSAGRPVRRVHRLLRGGEAPCPGDAGRSHALAPRPDPARIAAHEAAAFSFRLAVPCSRHLGRSRACRRHRRGRGM